MSLSDGVKRFNAKTREQSYLIHQKVTVDLFSEVVIGTPVMDGLARANWHVSYGAPSSITSGIISGGDAVSRVISDVASFDGIKNTAVYLTNNLPYIERLEFDGHSPQQPKGWVRAAVSRAKA